jgi:tRNA A-37 threonylcarbamoyl transferase component Bud32
MVHGVAALPDGIREGDVLAGKYRIGGTIGAGAMGTVVAAHHLILDERVAIKFLRADWQDRAGAVARFVHEARAAVRIRNEHVVRVFDIAVVDGGPPYIVMEYLDGCDLAAKLRDGGPLRVEDAVDYLLEACEAMAEAHRLDIVHRDLKPANLFLCARKGEPPGIKVLDFGISKTLRTVPTTLDLDETVHSAGVTQARAILGSPFYMSPEQMESAGDVDARTDIWALGVTLFELVTGGYPYTGTSLIQVYSKMVSQDSSIWRAALIKSSEGLRPIFAKCLAHERENRYASVAELASALAPFGSDRAAASLRRLAGTLTEPAPDDEHALQMAALRASDSTPRGLAKAVAPTGPRGRMGVMLASVIAGGALASVILSVAERMRNPGADLHESGRRQAIAAVADTGDEPPAAPTARRDEWEVPSRDLAVPTETAASPPVGPRGGSGPGRVEPRSTGWRDPVPASAATMPRAQESPKGDAPDTATPAASSRFGAKKIKEMLDVRE